MSEDTVTIGEAWDLADPNNACGITFYKMPDGSLKILSVYQGRAPFVFLREPHPIEYVETWQVRRHEADRRWPDRDD